MRLAKRFPLPALPIVSLLTLPFGTQAEMKYSCDELGQMAARFYKLKREGYELEDVLSVVQKATENNPEKETLLSTVAIEIYIDPSINSEDSAQARAVADCAL